MACTDMSEVAAGVPGSVPWLLEREYRQHRSLDPDGLPATFAAWHRQARARAKQLTRRDRIIRVVIHPRELEIWARQNGRAVNDAARLEYAGIICEVGDT
jgi:hypothetical protein